MKKTLHVDIMVNDRFYKTLHLKVDTTMQWFDDEIKDVADFGSIQNEILSQCPSLVNKNYRICL